ncbi:MAG: amidohydrolase [Planctomycetaceae bacterium]|nr:amidohydrolase [Planctomycetaceae bacterium]
MTNESLMHQIDTLLSHVWMVRTFLKHSEEAQEDDELREVHRGLYDYMLALGGPYRDKDEQAYLKQARKKLTKLRRTVDLFLEVQPEISSHTNFLMAAQSLSAAVGAISELLEVNDH